MGNSKSSAKDERKPLRKHVLRSSGRSAVLTGATGATGKFVLAQMIISPEWSKITVIHRRNIDLNDISKQSNVPFTDTQKAKVSIHVTDMTQLCESDEAIENNVKLFLDHDVSICTLGSTRAKSKTAAAFRAIDFDIVRDVAILSKRAGIKHFTLLSSQGANASIWANEWTVSAPLWYVKVKGEIENELISQKFDRLSIFRPGFLAREERITGGLVSKLYVCDLANVMVYDAESDDVESKEAEAHVMYLPEDIAVVLDSAVHNFNMLLNEKKAVDEDDIKQEVVENKEKIDKETEIKDKTKENEPNDETEKENVDEAAKEPAAHTEDESPKQQQEQNESQGDDTVEKDDATKNEDASDK